MLTILACDRGVAISSSKAGKRCRCMLILILGILIALYFLSRYAVEDIYGNLFRSD